jgi:hypothetical protein
MVKNDRKRLVEPKVRYSIEVAAMKKILVLTVTVMMLFSLFVNTASPARADARASDGVVSLNSGADNVFLPIITRPASGSPSSVELIDQAVKTGTISAEQGLIYKVFAAFSDPRLPNQYIGAGIGRDGDGIIAEVTAQARAGTLSAGAIQTLTPFFVPPDHTGSWYEFQSGTDAQADGVTATPVPPEWLSLTSANNKVKVYYLSTDAAGAANAVKLKAAIDAKIWDKLTGLMGRAPLPDQTGFLRIYLWDSYVDSDGTLVPFNTTTLGITVGTDCDQAPTVIYLPSTLPPGDETHAGMIQYATHEMMHAIQFGGTIQNCGDYSWLKEATATWAEDFVYKDANSEWGVASGYLDHPDYFLDDSANLHDYGAYLLPYFLTHQFNDNSIIKKMWDNAATEPNSYLAVKHALPAEWQDYFWGAFLATLWNKAPFGEYYNKADKLVSTVKPASNQVISAAGGEQIIPLNDNFVTGGIRFDHFTVASNVHSLTILNGLGKKLSKGPADLVYTTDGDQIYLADDLSDEDAAGTTLVVLMKIAGHDWQSITMGLGSIQTESHTTCIDAQGSIEELVVIQSNGDFDHPDTRTISPKGLPTTLFANNIPCWKYTGSASYTVYNAGVTYTFSTTNAVYGYPSSIGDFITQYPYLNDLLAYPYVDLSLLSADVNWSVSGSDSNGCAYSGSGSAHVSEQPGAGSQSIQIYNGVLAGSPTYRGYIGQGVATGLAPYTYSISGEDCGESSTNNDDPTFMEIPLLVNRAGVKVPSGGGNLSGSYKQDEPVGDYELMQWNLTPQKK